MAIPRDPSFDSSLALAAEGNTFISRRCERLGSDIFLTRLMLQKVVCMLGEEAAHVFYERGRMTRRGAMPKTTFWLLGDEGSVQSLDDGAHRARKGMFMSLMEPESRHRLAELTMGAWRRHLEGWRQQDGVVLLDEVQEVLCRAVCAWAGVPLDEDDVAERTCEFRAMIDGAGTIGPRSWRALMRRRRTERWIEALIARVRAGDLEVDDDSPLGDIAWHREPDGQLLPPEAAAVEVINLLRPTVAIARFVTFAALALHEHPTWRERLAAGADRELEVFTQEVRRFYPFFPVVGGRVREPFEWRGHQFHVGAWVLLDLYGTDHDPRIWDRPEAFDPDRFRNFEITPYNLVPQGGGDHDTGHRCPGEWVVIDLMKTVLRLLTATMTYDVPPQDLEVDLSRMPTAPASGFVIANVRPVSDRS